MKNFFLLLSLFAINFSFSQNINFEKIKKEVTNKNSPFFYDKLVKEFKDTPSELNTDSVKIQYLYYGRLYSTYYKKASEIKSQNLKFVKLTGSKKCSKAIKLGEELLDKDPVNLVTLMNLINCYKSTKGDEARVKKLGIQAEILLKAIAGQGNGKSKETSFDVTSLGDEFTLLNYLGVDLKKYTRTSEKSNPDFILDIWSKNNNYKEEHRNKIYIKVYSN